MRILIVTNLFPSPIHPGRAPFNLRQFRALAERHEVRVIAPIAFTDELRAWRRGEPIGSRRVVRDGLVVEHPRYGFTPRLMRGLYGHFYERCLRSSFRRLVAESRPDAVLACWTYPDGWATARLARSLDLPCAIKMHGSDVLTPTPQSSRAARTTEALRAADRLIAVSEHLASAAIARGADPTRITVVRNGVDRSCFCPGARAEARRELGLDGADEIILFAGNLVKVKGPDTLMRAFASVAAARPRARCVFLGEGPARAEVESIAERAALLDRVRWQGAVPPERMPTWFRAADLLVVPSRSEGIPNVLLEASACGTPWIATRVGGIPELVQGGASGGRLVPPDDPASLGQAIATSLEAPQACPIAVASWEESAEQLAAALERMVALRRADRRIAA
jgi:glycosyltransferase involved in cell wall biosynthesis